MTTNITPINGTEATPINGGRMNTVSEIRRTSPAVNRQRTTSLGDAGRPARSSLAGRGTYPKPHHLLIASLACWAVVVILIGVILI